MDDDAVHKADMYHYIVMDDKDMYVYTVMDDRELEIFTTQVI